MVDAAKSRYTGGFINDCREMQRRRGLCSGPNVQFSEDRKQRVWIKATKHIEPKKELFVPYGRNYWRKKERLLGDLDGKQSKNDNAPIRKYPYTIKRYISIKRK